MIGEDIGLMVAVAVDSSSTSLAQADELAALVFSAYLRGLRDTGWSGDTEMVRLAYTATMVLKVAISYLPKTLWYLLEESHYEQYRQYWDSPIETLVAGWSPITRWLLDRGDEALALIGR